MKRFTFAWKIDGSIKTAREHHASYRSAERRAKEMAGLLGVEVQVFWQGWTAKGQP